MSRKKIKKKKKFQISSWVMIVLAILFTVLMVDLLFGISFDRTLYQVDHEISLEIPKFMSVSSKEEGKIKFRTYRSVAAISKDMKRICKDYQKISCSNIDYYQNEEKDYTITYKIRRGLLSNYLTIDYQKGKVTCNFSNQEENLSKNCKFTRTYYLDFIKQTSDSEKIYATLSEYQGSTETVEISSIWQEVLVVGYHYEFTFEQIGEKKANESNFSDIFQSYVIVDIQPTSLLGLEQKQEPICE